MPKRSRRSSDFHFVLRRIMQPTTGSGINPASLGSCPVPQGLNDGVSGNLWSTTRQETGPGCLGEVVNTGEVGAYTFNFSQCIGGLNNGAAGGACRVLSAFARAKMGAMTMRIERIDSGGNFGMWQQPYAASASAAVPYIPVNFGTRTTLLRCHYLRVSRFESSMSSWNFSTIFRDPRRRTRTLRPGQSIVFRSHCKIYQPLKASHIIRHFLPNTDGGHGPEVALPLRTLEFPGPQRRLGWVPTGLLTRCQPPEDTTLGADFQDPDAGISIGLDNAQFSFMGDTILFVFDWDGAGEFSFAGTSGLATAGTYTPLSLPLVIRSEALPVTLRDFRLEAYTGVGGIINLQQFGYDPGGSATQPPVLVAASHPEKMQLPLLRREPNLPVTTTYGVSDALLYGAAQPFAVTVGPSLPQPASIPLT